MTAYKMEHITLTLFLPGCYIPKPHGAKRKASVDQGTVFALPIAASSILQQLFNSADVAVAGRFAEPGALEM